MFCPQHLSVVGEKHISYPEFGTILKKGSDVIIVFY